MPETSGFFNSKVLDDGSYDRVYLAENFADYFASFVGNGVFANKLNALQVIVDLAMDVKVRAGQAWINGYWYENDSDLSLTLSTAPTTGYRTDSIVVRYGVTDRSIKCYVKEGALNTANPAPTRDSEYYELVLAYVKVNAGTVRIRQSMITDKRGDNSVCGYVTGLIDQIDTTDFYTQLNGWLEEYMDKTENQYDSFSSYLSQKKNTADSDLSVFEGDLNTLKASATNDVNALIEEIRGLLDGDVATNLQNQVDNKLDKPTEETTTNESDFYASIGSKSDGSIDSSSVKFIESNKAGAGRVLMKKVPGQTNVITFADFRSVITDNSSGETKNSYLYDKDKGSLGQNTHYLVPANFYGGPNCLVDAPTWERLANLEDHSITYCYSMALMALEGTPKMSLADSTEFRLVGTRLDGLKIFSQYGFSILIFRNLKYANDLKEENFENGEFDVAVITSDDVKEMIGMPQESVPSLFDRMKLKWSAFQTLDTKTVTVNIFVNQNYADPPDPSEYEVVIKEYPVTSPYTQEAQDGNWFKKVSG